MEKQTIQLLINGGPIGVAESKAIVVNTTKPPLSFDIKGSYEAMARLLNLNDGDIVEVTGEFGALGLQEGRKCKMTKHPDGSILFQSVD